MPYAIYRVIGVIIIEELFSGMSDSRLISIVIPVYNVSEYVRECLDSVIAQTYTDIEIILVDDGSTDDSGRICDEYASRDSRIKVLHRRNGGPSVARNAALDICRGEYVTFIDADDVVSPQYIEILYKNLKKYGADISTVTYSRFCQMSELPEVYTDEKRYCFNGVGALEHVLYQNMLDSGTWGKMYDISLFNGKRFIETIWYEDLAIISEIYPNAKIVVHQDCPVYYYRKSNTSIMNRFVLKRADVLDVTDEIERRVSRDFPELLPAARDRRFSANMNILWLMSATGISDDTIVARCWKNIKELRMSSLLNPKVRMKNKIGALTSYGGLWLLRNVFKLFNE